MFYETAKGHGLPHDPFKAIVSPRPVGWISTRSLEGAVNLAPFSYFNAISDRPYLVLFSADDASGNRDHFSESGEDARNYGGVQGLAETRALVEKMVATSVNAPRGISEFGYAGLTPSPSRLVAAPRVAEAPASLECKVTDIYEPKALNGEKAGCIVVTGEVVGIHIDEAMLMDGRFDVVKAGNVARLGYFDYLAVTETFQLQRPRWKD